jgi:hypothetical protein
MAATNFTHDFIIQHTGRWSTDPAAFCIAFSVVFGANFNKFGVLNDLNDQTTRKSKNGLHAWFLGQTSTGLAFLYKVVSTI